MRIQLRQAMISVAILGIVFSSGLCAYKQRVRAGIADYHTREARRYRPQFSATPCFFPRTYYEVWASYHSEMAAKYREASRHPWIAVGPDPPPPEQWPDWNEVERKQ
jgi:hypothetical protein